MKYIDADKLIAELEQQIKTFSIMHNTAASKEDYESMSRVDCAIARLRSVLAFVNSLQQDQPANMIRWTGSNLQEVIDFTGRSPKFGEWFKSWDEFESYVHSHGDILKLFCEDGSHYEVPVGAWIVKTPDGYNVPSVARFIHVKQERPEVDLKKEIRNYNVPFNGWERLTYNTLEAIARHFYELGLNARKEE